MSLWLTGSETFLKDCICPFLCNPGTVHRFWHSSTFLHAGGAAGIVSDIHSDTYDPARMISKEE